ncbi:olfactory receptor 5B17-like [Xiphophorus hellerii]|uniref:olfactory receptor 5B17-like n=1 Tax=Xiphophorus hellerii TaxID=8084 RepID=UPI0013B3A3BD|nr:olfactory receptor 5B17-like [Xiphophorus hellerii]
MENTTLDLDLLLLEGLKVTPYSSIPAFILLLLIYVFVMLCNVGLVTMIALQRSLHQPMFLLFCNMGANDVLGASTIIPPVLSTVFTPAAQRYIRYSSCVLQAFFAHFHASVVHTVLMIMAFDRYVAVCKPLHYATIMTSRMVVKLSVSAWVVCLLLVALMVGLSASLSRCRAVVLNPFCDNPSLFKLSCESILFNNVYGLANTAVLLGSSLGSIMLTYLRIAMVCLTNRSKTNSTRALQTCGTHLVLYIITFVSGALTIILHRFPDLSDQRKMASILFHVVPPAMNAIVYGLQIKAVRQKIFILFTKNTTADMKG